jgi:hypothetical protein
MISYSTGLINSILGTAPLNTTLANGVIRVYSGAQPASADSAATGTLLGTVTLAGAAFTEGTATNGINFDAPVGRSISKAVAEDWKFKGIAAGTIGYMRFQGNAADAQASSSLLPRIDMSVGITSGDVRLSTVTSAVNSIITIDTFTITAA